VTFRQPSGEIHLKFITEIPNDGLIRFPGLFNQNWLLLADPSSLGEVLVHNSYDWEKPKDLRRFLRMILGDGLILVEGDEHKFQRKHLAPTFSFRHIKELYPIFWQKATDLVGRVTAEIHENPVTLGEGEKMMGGVVEVNHWANKVTMDIIGVAGMDFFSSVAKFRSSFIPGLGREVNSLYTTDDELVHNYEEILEPTTEKAIYFGANIILSPTMVGWLPWKLNQTLKNTTSTLRRICHEFVREKKAAIVNEKEPKIDILSGLIKSNNFGDDMLVDQLLTFLAAG
jgi:cytochrome P450